MTAFDQAELKLLTDLIQERFGLTFNGIRLEILESRLRPRLRELHLTTLRDYYQYLRFHPDRESEFARLPAMVDATTRPTSSARPTSSICWSTT